MKLMKPLSIILVLILGFVLFSNANFNTIDASNKEIEQYTLFEEEVTLSGKTTKVNVGFVDVIFKHGFISKDEYPVTFDISVYAEDGELYVEFEPDYEDFIKDVVIIVHRYDGYIYDVELEDFIYVEVSPSVMKVSHFSRWCFLR